MLIRVSAVCSAGSPVRIGDVLGRLPGNGFNWSVLYFHGVGVAPRGMDMVAFENACLHSAHGFLLGWDELLDFVGRIDQANDLLIVASTQPDRIDAQAVREDDYSGCEFVLNLFDSTSLDIAYDDKLEALFGAAGKVII